MQGYRPQSGGPTHALSVAGREFTAVKTVGNGNCFAESLLIALSPDKETTRSPLSWDEESALEPTRVDEFAKISEEDALQFRRKFTENLRRLSDDKGTPFSRWIRDNGIAIEAAIRTLDVGKSAAGTQVEWFEITTISLIQLLGVETLFYDSKNKEFYCFQSSSGCQLRPDGSFQRMEKPLTVLIHWQNHDHFEAMGLRRQDGRIQTLFESDSDDVRWMRRQLSHCRGLNHFVHNNPCARAKTATKAA